MKGSRTGLTYMELMYKLWKQIKPNAYTKVLVEDIFELCDEVGKHSKDA